LKVEHIPHHRDLAILREEMVVIETQEGASHHRIAKMKGSFEQRYATGEMLPDTEVTGSPGHLLSEAKQTGRDPGDCAFPRPRSGGHVHLNIAREIERALDGRANVGCELDDRQNGPRVGSGVMKS